MNERLKQLRKFLGLNQSDFGARVGVTNPAISKIEKGKNNLSEQMIIAICREYNVNEEWLRSGAGDMFVEIPTATLDKLAHEYALPDMAKRIVKAFVELDAPEMGKFLDLVREIVLDEVDAETAKEMAIFSQKELSIDEKVELYRQRLVNAKRGVSSSMIYENQNTG